MWLRLTQATLGTSPSIWFRYLFRFVTGVSGWIWRNIQVVWSDHVFFGKRRGPRICPRGLFIMSGRRPAEREESTHPRFRRWQAHRIYFLSSIELGTVSSKYGAAWEFESKTWLLNFHKSKKRSDVTGHRTATVASLFLLHAMLPSPLLPPPPHFKKIYC